MTLTECVQLHETIEIHYYVSHYAAQLFTQDGQRKVLEGRGQSVDEAMSDLMRQCWKVPDLKTLRNLDARTTLQSH